MAKRSHIEWTEMTWNPVTGCTKISAGCKHCYAEVMARRLQAMGTEGYQNGFAISLLPARLEQPLRRSKPTVWFVNSMSDLFHPEVPFDFVDRVFDVIEATPWHVYQILTKRPERMAAYVSARAVPSHVWLGTTVENRRHGVPRIDILRGVRARLRFLSIEPLLEDVGLLDLTGIHWVIVGGESGTSARPMRLAWACSLRDQCLKSNVPFFFKQWGAYGPDGVRRPKSVNGRLLEGELYDGMPSLYANQFKSGTAS